MLSFSYAQSATKAIFKNTAILSLILLPLIFQSSKATAQVKGQRDSVAADTASSRFEIGIAAGPSFNQFSKGQPHTSSNMGYAAGISLNYKFTQALSLQIEANSLQQGGRALIFKDDTRLGLDESFQTKNTTSNSYRISTIEIPLLLNYTFNIKQSWMPTFYLGGSYAYTYHVSNHYQKTGDLLTGADIIATVSGNQDVSASFNKSRVNAIAGANVKLPLTNRLQLLIDMRYLQGITPAVENYSYMDKIGFGSNLRTSSFITKVGLVYSVF